MLVRQKRLVAGDEDVVGRLLRRRDLGGRGQIDERRQPADRAPRRSRAAARLPVDALAARMRQLVALEQSRRDDLVGAGRNASVHPAEQQRREAGARQLRERDLPPRLQHLLPRADHLAHEPVAEKREHVAGRGGVAREHVAKVGFVGETRRAPGDGVDHALGRGEAVRHDVEPADGRAVAPHHPVARSRDGDRRSLVIDRSPTSARRARRRTRPACRPAPPRTRGARAP